MLHHNSSLAFSVGPVRASGRTDGRTNLLGDPSHGQIAEEALPAGVGAYLFVAEVQRALRERLLEHVDDGRRQGRRDHVERHRQQHRRRGRRRIRHRCNSHSTAVASFMGARGGGLRTPQGL